MTFVIFRASATSDIPQRDSIRGLSLLREHESVAIVVAGLDDSKRGPQCNLWTGSAAAASSDPSNVASKKRLYHFRTLRPRKSFWSSSKNVGTSWSTNTGIASLVKRLREYVEEQEKSAPKLDSGSKPGSANPQN